MKALNFAQVVREKSRVTIPKANVTSLCRELGMPSIDGYILIFEIKSIKSPHGVEFLEQKH